MLYPIELVPNKLLSLTLAAWLEVIPAKVIHQSHGHVMKPSQG